MNINRIRLLQQECRALSDHIKDAQSELDAKKAELEKLRVNAPMIESKFRINGVECPSTFDGPDCIRFKLALVNKDEIDEYRNIWGSVSADTAPRVSVAYRFVPRSDDSPSYEGIVAGGGGHCFLRSEGESPFSSKIPCTREEWNMIRKGNIPEKFRPDWYVQDSE